MRISDWSSDVCSSDLFDTQQGFGLRGLNGETTGFAHANELSESAIRRAAETVKLVAQGHGGEIALAPPRTNARLYTDENPLELVPFARKVALCQQIDAAARARDPRVAQVSVGLSRSEEHTSELQSLMSISYAVFCL